MVFVRNVCSVAESIMSRLRGRVRPEREMWVLVAKRCEVLC